MNIARRIYRPGRQNGGMPENLSPSHLQSRWTVVCLCAAWCGSCRDYRRLFGERAASADDAVHVWVDIEDESDWLDIDIETFPTLLVLRDAEPMFLGPVLPQIGLIERTLKSLRQSGGLAIPDEHLSAVESLIGATRELRAS
jgi:hypothetical protein